MNSSRQSRSRFEAFVHAFAGWKHLLTTQRNAWIHALATLATLLLGSWLALSSLEWALITIAITLVWTTELLNTAFEAIVDLASPDFHPLAKTGKDVAAAAVLMAALAAIVIGLLVMGPPLWQRLSGV